MVIDVSILILGIIVRPQLTNLNCWHFIKEYLEGYSCKSPNLSNVVKYYKNNVVVIIKYEQLKRIFLGSTILTLERHESPLWPYLWYFHVFEHEVRRFRVSGVR